MGQSKPILFLHPMLRNYRLGVYNRLAKEFDMTFVFTSARRLKVAEDILPHAKFGYLLPPDHPLPPFYSEGFSLGLIKELAKTKYGTVVASIVASFPAQAAFVIAKLTGKKYVLWDEQWWWPGG